MVTERTGRPVADAALDWAEHGGDVPPELERFRPDSQDLLHRLAAESLETGAWAKGLPTSEEQT